MEKFILAGFPRTGTTVLAGSLTEHKNVLFYGELFSNTLSVRESESARITMGAGWKFEKQLNWPMPACSYEGSAQPYLDKLYSQDVPQRAIGFKIMYDQALEGPNSDFWTYIKSHPEIKIIQTKRDNVLEIVCSYVRASMTRRWHAAGEMVPNKHKFVVPPQEVLKMLEKFQKLPEAMLGIKESHQVLEIDYESINQDFKACMSQIYAFLELDEVETAPRLQKIASLKPNEELANYGELKNFFKNTPYNKHFIY